MEENKKHCDCGCEDCGDECDCESELIELEDDKGNTVKFEVYCFTEYEGKKYVGLIPAEKNDAVGEDEMAIFELNEESEQLLPIEDEKLLDAVFEQMLAEDECDCCSDDCDGECDCEDCAKD